MFYNILEREILLSKRIDCNWESRIITWKMFGESWGSNASDWSIFHWRPERDHLKLVGVSMQEDTNPRPDVMPNWRKETGWPLVFYFRLSWLSLALGNFADFWYGILVELRKSDGNYGMVKLLYSNNLFKFPDFPFFSEISLVFPDFSDFQDSDHPVRSSHF